MQNQFDLTDDQREIQELARRFTADRITPFAAEWDERSHYPVDVWKAAGELGFGSIYVSEESGGIALGRLEAALIMEAMAYGCPATSACRPAGPSTSASPSRSANRPSGGWRWSMSRRAPA